MGPHRAQARCRRGAESPPRSTAGRALVSLHEGLDPASPDAAEETIVGAHSSRAAPPAPPGRARRGLHRTGVPRIPGGVRTTGAWSPGDCRTDLLAPPRRPADTRTSGRPNGHRGDPAGHDGDGLPDTAEGACLPSCSVPATPRPSARSMPSTSCSSSSRWSSSSFTPRTSPRSSGGPRPARPRGRGPGHRRPRGARHLAGHPGVDTLHITGADRTHDRYGTGHDEAEASRRAGAAQAVQRGAATSPDHRGRRGGGRRLGWTTTPRTSRRCSPTTPASGTTSRVIVTPAPPSARRCWTGAATPRAAPDAPRLHPGRRGRPPSVRFIPQAEPSRPVARSPALGRRSRDSRWMPLVIRATQWRPSAA